MAKTLVVKVGTSTLTGGTTRLSKPNMVELARQIAKVHSDGYQILLVSSGAMAAGREVLGYPQLPSALPVKQMLSAVGQGHLMRIYSDLFALYDVRVGQVLVTVEDLQRNRARYLNARDTLNMLLEYNILPVINENDTVAVDEIKLGDNDNLSAMIAALINADSLLILTDQDGLYDKDPRHNPGARRIEVVERIDSEIYAIADHKTSNGLGVGGMRTKVQAAELAGRSGIDTIITSGSAKDVILRVLDGETLGTRFLPSAPRVESRKRWLLAEKPQGVIRVDDGAAAVLERGAASLLPVGMKAIEGTFKRGALVGITTETGTEIAHGLTNYGSLELNRLCGVQSDQIEAILGYSYGEEAIHRDNLVLLKGRNND